MVTTFDHSSSFDWLKEIGGGVTAPKGFVAAGLHAGLKRKRKDLALLVSEVPAAAAGTFTTNLVKAAPVIVSQEHLSEGYARAVVVNSGNANACNGERGLKDARAMAGRVAELLAIPSTDVVVSSTGVIGQPLPMDIVMTGIDQAVNALSPDGGHDAALAIMTTDTKPKEIAVSFEIEGKEVRIAGMAKGSGMIHPNMATMLAFVTTDAAIDSGLLGQTLKASVDKTFNLISVDGDTSTNDMVLCMANGMSETKTLESGTPAYNRFCLALDYVNTWLAKEIVKDGEGATKLIEVHVKGAPDWDTAKTIGKSIAGSSLVKTAVYGEDANWGRIFCAAGYSGADFDPMKVDIYLGDVAVAQNGMGLPFDEARASDVLRKSEVMITVNLNTGSADARVWTCDLTSDYIKINASYRS